MLNENRFLGTFRGHNTRTNIYFFKKSSKKCENNGKNITSNLDFIDKFLFCHPYVTMPNVSLNLV